MPDLEYSILGPVTVRRGADDSPIALSEKLTLLLARLLVEPGTVVPATTLAQDVWDEEVELRDPQNSVQRLVSQLRQRLGDMEEPRRIVVSVGAAYRIDADPLSVDAERFRRLARRGHALLETHPRAARVMLEEALASWRGPVLGGYGQLRWVRAIAAELETAREQAEVDLNESLLSLGDHEQLELRLRRQLAEHPTAERRHGQLIRTLEAAGREAEASLAYRDAVKVLGTPGRQLRRIGEGIGRPMGGDERPRGASQRGVPSSCVLLHAALASSSPEPGGAGLGTALLLVDQQGGEPHPVDADRLLAFFDDVAGAARAARTLAGYPRLHCAVGLHRGEVVQLGDRLGGPALARCRLLADAAGPRRVLVSSAVRQVGGESIDLDERRHPDLLPGEPVFELADGRNRSASPPASTLDNRPHNLPGQLSRFVGRAGELAAIVRRVAPGQLITLVGAGGTGKTRIALQVAADRLTHFADGAWLAGLADLPPDADEEAVALTIVAQLSARALSEEPAHETLVRHLADRSALLVLDNCEHVLPACEQLIARIRRECPLVCVLATSRRPLHVDGELVVEVPAMQVETVSGADGLPDAIELLLERAGSLGVDASAHPHVLDEVRALCAALDGSPLAIELAAGQVARRGLLPVASEVRAMVRGERGLGSFESDDPSRAPRQRTIEAAIRWGYDLLGEQERTVLRRLAVFRGSFGLDEAQGAVAGGSVPSHEVPELVSSLVDASLVVPEPAPAGSALRLRLWHAIRTFAHQRLEESGELERTRRAHADAYRALATRVAPTLFGPGEQAGLDLLEGEHGNMRAALAHLVEARRSPEALELVDALWWLWFSHGHVEEGCDWVARALALDDEPSRARVRALRVGSHLEWWRGDYTQTERYNDELDRCARAIGDEWGVAWALMGHGAVVMFGDPEAALPVFEDSRRRFDSLGREWEAGYALQLVAAAHWYAARENEALAAYEETSQIFERLGHGQVLASVRRGMGLMAARCGQPERGRALCRQALGFSTSIGDRSGAAQALNFLAAINLAEGELVAAAEQHGEALARAREVGDLWATCSALDGVATVACEVGELGLAARLLAHADALAERSGYDRPAQDRERRAEWEQLLRAGLGPGALARATSEGELMSAAAAVAAAQAFVRRLG